MHEIVFYIFANSKMFQGTMSFNTTCSVVAQLQARATMPTCQERRYPTTTFLLFLGIFPFLKSAVFSH